MPGRSPRLRHNSSVMNGMIGCRRCSNWSSTQAVAAWVSARTAASALSPWSSGLVNSRYQSQKVPQVKW